MEYEENNKNTKQRSGNIEEAESSSVKETRTGSAGIDDIMLQQAITWSIERIFQISDKCIDVTGTDLDTLDERHATIYTDGSYYGQGTMEAQCGMAWIITRGWDHYHQHWQK